MRFTATQPGKTPGALALDQGSEPRVNQSSAPLYPSYALGFGQEARVQIDGGAHRLLLFMGSDPEGLCRGFVQGQHVKFLATKNTEIKETPNT